MTEKKQAANKNKGGRPSTYDTHIANVICIRIGEGESLRAICREAGMPDKSTIFDWLRKHPEFADHYVRAREDQAETMAEEIVDIADETPETTPVYDKDGNVVDIKLDSAYISWQKNRIDARKWTASKLRPKKYGDKVVHAGDDVNPVIIENNHNVFGELLKNLKMQRQSEQ